MRLHRWEQLRLRGPDRRTRVPSSAEEKTCQGSHLDPSLIQYFTNPQSSANWEPRIAESQQCSRCSFNSGPACATLAHCWKNIWIRLFLQGFVSQSLSKYGLTVARRRHAPRVSGWTSNRKWQRLVMPGGKFSTSCQHTVTSPRCCFQ